jgi:NAD(P)-dependent dehydrogenase (short-subunit alcohol dehydrogenase family)
MGTIRLRHPGQQRRDPAHRHLRPGHGGRPRPQLQDQLQERVHAYPTPRRRYRRRGRIINLGSGTSRIAPAPLVSYGPIKAAVQSLTSSWRGTSGPRDHGTQSPPAAWTMTSSRAVQRADATAPRLHPLQHGAGTNRSPRRGQRGDRLPRASDAASFISGTVIPMTAATTCNGQCARSVGHFSHNLSWLAIGSNDRQWWSLRPDRSSMSID